MFVMIQLIAKMEQMKHVCDGTIDCQNGADF